MIEAQKRGWMVRERARMLAESYAADIGLGILTGTRVATPAGFRAVETLHAGDRVLTFGNRMQPLDWVERRIVWCGRNAEEYAWPLLAPVGALGNREEMYLMPAQNIVIDCELAEQVFGSPYVLIPATALVGHFGITRTRPTGALEVVRFGFAQDEVVFANSGAMFHCGPKGDFAGDPVAEDGNFTVMSEEEARHFLTCLEQGDYPVRTRN